MNVASLVEALGLPTSTSVCQRVPKKMLLANGKPSNADKRRISTGIEEITWLATLKPNTVGVPAFCDSTREYLEIVILSVTLRIDAQTSRLVELIHMAVPYPVFLIAAQGDTLGVSLAHKRWSQGEAGATVIDGPLVTIGQGERKDEGWRAFTRALSISGQPQANLYMLYQGWIDTLIALLAARLTGAFISTESAEHAAVRRNALAECERIETQMTHLRATASKERQLARQVELNSKLNNLKAEYSAARAKL